MSQWDMWFGCYDTRKQLNPKQNWHTKDTFLRCFLSAAITHCRKLCLKTRLCRNFHGYIHQHTNSCLLFQKWLIFMQDKLPKGCIVLLKQKTRFSIWWNLSGNSPPPKKKKKPVWYPSHPWIIFWVSSTPSKPTQVWKKRVITEKSSTAPKETAGRKLLQKHGIHIPVCFFKWNISIVGFTPKKCRSQALYNDTNVYIVFWIFLVIIIFHCKQKS